MRANDISTRFRCQNIIARLSRVRASKRRWVTPNACSILQAFETNIQQSVGLVNSSTSTASTIKASIFGSLGSRRSLASLRASQRLHRSFDFVDSSSGSVEETRLRMIP